MNAYLSVGACGILWVWSHAGAWEVTSLPSPVPPMRNAVADPSLEGQGWRATHGAVIVRSARTGSRAGRIERASDKVQPLLSGTFGPVRPGKWLLSAWLRCSLPPSADPNYAAVLEVTWLDGDGKSLGSQRGPWLNGRCHVWRYREAKLPAPTGAVRARLTFRFNFSVVGRCEIDDVALTPVADGADEAADVKPLDVRPVRSIFAPGEPIRVQFRLENVSTHRATSGGRLHDSRGRLIREGRGLPLPKINPPPRHRNVTVYFEPDGIPQNEWLVALVSAEAQGCRYAGKAGILVRPRPTDFGEEANSPFALLVGHPYTKRWLGARWQRPNFGWNTREHELANRYGVTTLALVGAANGVLHGRTPMAEYAQFVQESAQKYVGMIRWWQMGNEPPLFRPGMAERYVAVLKAGYRAAKRAAPDCVVSMAGLTGLNVDPEMLAKFLDAGGGHWCDVIDLHLYVAIDAMDKLLTKTRGDMAARSVHKPIILTEVTANLEQTVSEREKAGHVYKRYAVAASHDVAQLYWFVTHWVNALPGGFRHCGLIDVTNHAPWPAAAAYGRLSDAITGATFVRREITSDQSWVFEFRRGNRSLWVVWAERGDPRLLAIPCGDGTARLIDVAGHEWARPVAGRLVITVTEEPLLLDLPAGGQGTIGPAMDEGFTPARALLSRGGEADLRIRASSGSEAELDCPPGLTVKGNRLRTAADFPPGNAVVWAFTQRQGVTAAALRLPVTVTEPLSVKLSPLPSATEAPSRVRVCVRNLSPQVQEGTFRVVSPLSAGVRPAELARQFAALRPNEAAKADLVLPVRPDPLGRYRFHLEVQTASGVRATDSPTLVFMAARQFARSPRIDGKLDEWGEDFAMHVGPHTGERQDPKDGAPRDESDLSGRAAVRWDASALYLAVRVRDDVHCNNRRDGALWDGDGLQFGVTPDPDRPDAPRAELGCALTPDGPQTWIWHGLPRAPTGPVKFPAAIVRRDAETIYEMAIPWSLLPGIKPEPTTWIGFALLVNEQDSANRGCYGWHGGVSVPKDPSKFGQICSVDE